MHFLEDGDVLVWNRHLDASLLGSQKSYSGWYGPGPFIYRGPSQQIYHGALIQPFPLGYQAMKEAYNPEYAGHITRWVKDEFLTAVYKAKRNAISDR